MIAAIAFLALEVHFDSRASLMANRNVTAAASSKSCRAYNTEPKM